MTRVLAFDTSTPWCNVCVSHNQAILAQASQYLPQAHSRDLVPMIQKVLTEANLSFKEIDKLATILGPGSFTGLRVGLATAQGISLALGKPIVALDTFRAYALSLKVKNNILVLIESQKTDIYCQLLDNQGNPLKKPMAMPPDQISQYVNEGPFALTGDGAEKILFLLDEHKKSYEYHFLSANLVCQCLARFAEKQSEENLTNAEPFYLSPCKIIKS